jgi:hypothetical protein
MNRRGFLTSLIGGVLAAGVAPNILAGAGRKWVKAKSGLYIINPDWVNAPFELGFIASPGMANFMVKQPNGLWSFRGFSIQHDGKLEMLPIEQDPYPRRFLDANMEREVYPLKYAD